MTKKDFIDKFHLASPQEQARMILDLVEGIRDVHMFSTKIEPEKPRFEWKRSHIGWDLLDANQPDDRLIAAVYNNFPGDIEEAKAQLLRIAEAGR